MIDVLAALSDPGRADRPNEDLWGTAGAFAWVIDGATGLGERRLLPGPSDAAWLAGALGEALDEGAARADDPADLLRRAAQVVAKRFAHERIAEAQERYEVPTAAVVLARFAQGAVRVAELGDCALHVFGRTHRRVGGTERGRALEDGWARRLMASGGGRTDDVLEHLRRVRNKANQPDGYPIFAPEAGCADAARTHEIAEGEGTALLMTDGFEAALHDYGLREPGELTQPPALKNTLAALREVERADPDCTRYPRFKPSDDATAVLVRFS